MTFWWCKLEGRSPFFDIRKNGSRCKHQNIIKVKLKFIEKFLTTSISMVQNEGKIARQCRSCAITSAMEVLDISWYSLKWPTSLLYTVCARNVNFVLFKKHPTIFTVLFQFKTLDHKWFHSFHFSVEFGRSVSLKRVLRYPICYSIKHWLTALQNDHCPTCG